MKSDDTNRAAGQTPRQRWAQAIIALCVAALLGLGTWLAMSLFRDQPTGPDETYELTAGQRTELIIRNLRIHAATDITPSWVASIPEASRQMEQLTCGSRFAESLNPAVVELRGIEYFSTLAGARELYSTTWRAQQEAAHEGIVALQRLVPEDCRADLPISFDVSDEHRNAAGVSVREMLAVSDELVAQWSQLYLLAESTAERDVALAGLWQVLQWEHSWQPGQSPFAFQF